MRIADLGIQKWKCPRLQPGAEPVSSTHFLLEQINGNRFEEERNTITHSGVRKI
jgi:hypothetical protein